jgi:hypothetical protein
MQQLKTPVVIFLFWLPVATSLLLNPGRNFHNLGSFSDIELATLLLCGVLEMSCFLLLISQPKYLSNLFKTCQSKLDWFKYVFFSGLMGILTINFTFLALVS